MWEYRKITFDELCGEEPKDEDKPFLDRTGVCVSDLTQDQAQWRKEGVLILKNFIPHSLIDAYSNLREKLAEKTGNQGGWRCDCPYLHYKELKDLCLYRPLSDKLTELLGDKMGLHLNLTGWVSTERNWHQDDYLNPEFVNASYAAVWFALDSIHPESGPFEYVPRSHRWPLTRRGKLWERLTKEEISSPEWPGRTQEWVSEAFENEIEKRGGIKKQFLGEKGDVLIWHGRLAHRGTEPKDRSPLRKSLIAHYSGVERRKDMHGFTQYKDQGFYFDLGVQMDASEKIESPNKTEI